MREIITSTKTTVKVGDCENCPFYRTEHDMQATVPICELNKTYTTSEKCPLADNNVRVTTVVEAVAVPNPDYKWAPEEHRESAEFVSIQQTEDEFFMKILKPLIEEKNDE